jgi:RNA polymerase sigma factor (sigma-70 family)
MTHGIHQTDGELLAAFADNGSESPFAALVSRHETMVHGVALRVLRDHHEAQDVAQAVFLALARKARTMQRVSSVGGWLHVVAWRLAVKVRLSRQARQQREQQAMREREQMHQLQSETGPFHDELDAALGQLPARYRQPLVLFHLEGRSLEETARQLRLKPATAGTRLARGRELLRRKLVRRGVKIGSVGALVALFPHGSPAAALPSTFAATTAKCASLGASGAATPQVAALTQAVSKMLFWGQVKTVAIVASSLAVVVTGAVAVRQLTQPKATPPMPPPLVATEVSTPARANAPVAPPLVNDPAATRPVHVIAVWSRSVTQAGLQISIGLEKTVWAADEPVDLTVRLKNVSRKPILLAAVASPDSWQVQLNTWQVEFHHPAETMADTATTLIPGQEMDISIVCDAAWFRWIAPTAPTVAGSRRRQLLPGRYSLRVRRLFLPASETAAMMHWSGLLESAPLSIEITSPPATNPLPAVNEYQAQQLAQLWVSGLLAGRVDQVVAVSDVPFCWDKVAVVKTAEELKTKLEAVVQNKGVRNLVAGEAIVLKDQAAAQATEWFKQMETADLTFVTVVVEAAEGKKAGITVAIKPGTPSLKVVGFAD